MMICTKCKGIILESGELPYGNECNCYELKLKADLKAQEELIKALTEFYEKIKENKYEADKVVIYLDRYFSTYKKAKELIKE